MGRHAYSNQEPDLAHDSNAVSRRVRLTRVFLSYAKEDRQVAEEISLAVDAGKRDVFFDKTCLPSAGDYHSRIRIKIKNSDLFIFLISPDSVASGRYTLTELKYACDKWSHPTGRVLPVEVRETDLRDIPPYLKSVTILKPTGNPSGEVAGEVSKLEARIVPQHAKYTRPQLRYYFDYLDQETSSMGRLCIFSLLSGLASIALWHMFHTLSYPHLRAGAASAFSAALMFYLQGSHLGWLRGQMALTEVHSDANSFTLRDWLTYADGWATWVRYQTGWIALSVSVVSYIVAFGDFVPEWLLWLSLYPLLCLVVFVIALRWYVLTAFSDEDEPFKAWRKSLSS